mmetsp:Transcript_14085/g.38067  ORF Transcript_14085/g.38067 Transcript_14085/m.38067 type:complete len:108 (+) Transcript_14085:1148-1471(+)
MHGPSARKDDKQVCVPSTPDTHTYTQTTHTHTHHSTSSCTALATSNPQARASPGKPGTSTVAPLRLIRLELPSQAGAPLWQALKGSLLEQEHKCDHHPCPSMPAVAG